MPGRSFPAVKRSGMAKESIRILLVDDHAIVRAGCKRLLDTASDIVVVGEAEDLEQTLAACRLLNPNVVILDISLPHQGGLAVLDRLKQKFPNIRVLILSVHEREPFPSTALRKGADGYLTKNCAPDELISAVRALAAGRQYISADIATCILLAKENPEILPVFDNLFGVPPETKKGGASHEISNNGIWSFSDPNSAKSDIGRNAVEKLVNKAIKFIETWKQMDNILR